MDNAKPSAGMSLREVLAARKAAREQELNAGALPDGEEAGAQSAPEAPAVSLHAPRASEPSGGAPSLGQKLREAHFNPSQSQPGLFVDEETPAPQALPGDPLAQDDAATEPRFVAREELNAEAAPLAARIKTDATAPWNAGETQKSGAERLSAAAKSMHDNLPTLSSAADEAADAAAKPRASRLRPLRATQKLSGAAAVAHRRIALDAGGLASAKGENGWPREMELFAKAELPTIKIPAFSDDENPARRRFLNRMLRFATHEGREDIAEACVKLGAPASGESERDDGSSLMGEVASLGNLGAINLLLKLGADSNERSGEKKLTPLMWLAFSPQPLDSARSLMAHGADVNATSPNGKTALIQALEAQNKIYAAFLLQKGAKIDAIDDEGQSALAIACALGAESEELTLEILAAGAAPDAGVFEGRRPIEWAIARGQETVMRKLLEAGASAEAPARDGGSLADWARDRSHEELALILAQAKNGIAAPRLAPQSAAI